jgi:Mor family transcriptional regulator
MDMKTRIAYGEHENGNTYYLGDTIEAALKANMMYKDYEKALIKANPQLKITFKIKSR